MDNNAFGVENRKAIQARNKKNPNASHPLTDDAKFHAELNKSLHKYDKR